MRAARAVLFGLGLLGIGVAVVGVLTDTGTRPLPQLLFLVGLIVVHDGILLPVVIGVGVLTVRYVRGWARAPVQAGLYASAALCLFAIPFLTGFGRIADNPTRLPLSYPRGLIIVLLVVWAGAGGWALLRWRRRSRPGPEVDA